MSAITGDVQEIYPEHYKWPAKYLEVKWGQHESVNAFKRWAAVNWSDTPMLSEMLDAYCEAQIHGTDPTETEVKSLKECAERSCSALYADTMDDAPRQLKTLQNWHRHMRKLKGLPFNMTDIIERQKFTQEDLDKMRLKHVRLINKRDLKRTGRVFIQGAPMEREWPVKQVGCSHALSHCETSLPDGYMRTEDIEGSGDESDATAETFPLAGNSLATSANASFNVTGSNF